MDILIHINGQTAGRDKIARTVQYASRFLWYELQQMKANIYLVEKLQILESTCSSFRKLLRFGRCADSLYSAVASLNNPDFILRITLALSKVANSLFLFADHIVWLSRAGFLKDVDANKWNMISNRYWLLNVIFNIIRDLYEIQKILYRRNMFSQFKSEISNQPYNLRVYLSILQKVFFAVKSQQDVFTDTLKNFCDLWIPLVGLQKVSLKPGTVGFLGTVSSLAALFAMLRPIAKLTPA